LKVDEIDFNQEKKWNMDQPQEVIEEEKQEEEVN
jgi:hypothetical protein